VLGLAGSANQDFGIYWGNLMARSPRLGRGFAR